MSIVKQLQKEVDEFQAGEPIEIVSRYFHRQYDTVDKIIRLYNSKFEKGELDSEGFRKYFYNIVRNPCTVSTKAVAFDVSDIQVTAAPGSSYRKAWIADRDFKYWAKTQNLPLIMSRVFHELPIFGSVVLKKVKGKWRFVDLRNLINEQQADSLDRAEYVIEQHFMTPEEFRKTNWKKKDEILEAWRATKKPYIRFFERRGEVSEADLDEKNGDPDKMVRAVTIIYIPETRTADRFGNPVSGIVAWNEKESLEDFPYREFHWEKIPGRWLGIGRVEINADPQIRTNELTNLRVKSSYYASLNLWQTRDTTIPKNLIRQVANGDILQVMSEITRMPTEERNHQSFTQEETRWMQNRDEQSMTFDVIRGERLPAGTPLGSAQLAAQMASSYFDGIRKNVAASLKRYIAEDVFQDFLAGNQKEHYVKLVGEDLDQWNALMKTERMNQEVLKFVTKNNKMPTQAQFDMMAAVITEREFDRKETSIKINGKELYKDFDYEIDIVITEQMKKMMARAANMVTVLQALQQDPELLQDPAKRNIFRQLLESIGMNLSDIEPMEATQQATVSETAGQHAKGGGISSPRQPVEAPPENVI